MYKFFQRTLIESLKLVLKLITNIQLLVIIY